MHLHGHRASQAEEPAVDGSEKAAVEPQVRPERKDKRQLFGKDEKVTYDAVIAKERDIISSRGRKGTSAAEQKELLGILRRAANEANLGAGLRYEFLSLGASCVLRFCVMLQLSCQNNLPSRTLSPVVPWSHAHDHPPSPSSLSAPRPLTTLSAMACAPC